MSRPSCNNRRKTRGLFTTNPKQYFQLQNFEKYEHIYNTQLDCVIVINRRTRDSKGTFGYNELVNYLETNNNHECLNRVKKLQNNNSSDDFNFTNMNSES